MDGVEGASVDGLLGPGLVVDGLDWLPGSLGVVGVVVVVWSLMVNSYARKTNRPLP